MNMTRDKSSIEYQIAERQLAMKDSDEKSWFNYIKSTLDLYDMPSVYTLLQQDFSKPQWKKLLNSSINSFVEASWKEEVENKTSLKYLNPDKLKVGQCHPVWGKVRSNILDNKRAQLKCKLLTGTYILQGNLAAFNQYTVDPTCKLCGEAPEARQHFISECSTFDSERKDFVGKLQNNQLLEDHVEDCLHNPELLTQLVLDASAILRIETSREEILDALELYSREYLYRIHRRRIAKLKLLSLPEC